MNTPPDGGPAFPMQCYDFQPTTGQQVVREQFSGLSLRDWFAGRFAAEMINGWSSVAGAAEKHGPSPTEAMAAIAYNLADSMLIERSKNKAS